LYRLTIEQEAKDNLRAHYQNLRTRHPGSLYPSEWYYGIRAAIRELARMADECGPAYEDRFFVERIRHRLFESYKILFAIRADRVHVLHIRHQAQDPADLPP
jgi:plasmid stabilization system protein ParE